MNRSTLFRMLCIPAGALVLACWTGCGQEYDAPTEPAADADAPVETAAPEASEAMLAVLARADRADGQEDRVVSRCLGCGLAMDGNADHALEVSGYSLHLCSETCKDHVGEDVNAAVQAVKLPDE